MRDTTNLPHAQLDIEELYKHRSFLERLARGIIADEQGIEDTLQETWLKALQRPPASYVSLRNWLGQIVRNTALSRLRKQRSANEHEPWAARQEFDPTSSLDAVQMIERQQLVLGSLMLLDEPRRTTLHLRYFKGLPPAEIARQMQVPLGTVNDRLRTGRDELRRILAPKLGVDGGLPSLLGIYLLPLAGLSDRAASLLRSKLSSLVAPGSALVAAPIAGVFGGIAMGKLALGLSVVVLLTLGMGRIFGWPGDAQFREGMPLGGEGELIAAGQEEEAVPSKARDESEVATLGLAVVERQALQPDPLAIAADRAELRVQVTWEDDGQPAAGINVLVYCSGDTNSHRNQRHLRTDEEGRLMLLDLAPGRVSVTVVRSCSGEVKARAGQQHELKLSIPNGMDLKGKVVDGEGIAVRGASIWLSQSNDGINGGVVAVSDENGAFQIRDLSAGHSIAARVAGHAPSGAYQLLGNPGDLIEQTLIVRGQAGAVRGVVRDSGGQPIRGARVLLSSAKGGGDRLEEPSYIYVEPAPPQLQFTGPDGSFEFLGCPTGAIRLTFGAKGHGPTEKQFSVVSGQTREIAISLQPQATVSGRVIAANGDGIEGVFVYCRGSTMMSFAASSSGADGSYRLVGLEEGLLSVLVESDEHGSSRANIESESGVEAHWDAVLKRHGRDRTGVLLDVNGLPLEGWDVCAIEPQQVGAVARFAQTSFKGEFTLINVPVKASGLSIWEPGAWRGASTPAMVLRDVEFNDDQLKLVVTPKSIASAYLSGRILNADGKPVVGAQITAGSGRMNSSYHMLADSKTGRFHLGPIKPGSFSIINVTAPGYGTLVLEECAIAQGEDIDLGTLTIGRAGSLLVRLASEESIGAYGFGWLSCVVKNRAGLSIDSVEMDGIEGRSGPLATGEYELHLAGNHVIADVLPFTVSAGQTTLLVVDPVFGACRPLRFTRASGLPFAKETSVSLQDSNGLERAIFYQSNSPGATDQGPWSIYQAQANGLSAGTYYWEMSYGLEIIARGAFEVIQADPKTKLLEFVVP